MLKYNLISIVSIIIIYYSFQLIISVHSENVIDRNVIKTSTGLIRGRILKFDNTEVLALTGVPYAKPPIGILRFRRPISIDPWLGILNATKLPSTCVQESFNNFPGFKGEAMWNPNTNISEDCLYLNVWIPLKQGSLISTSGNLSSMLVWIYGGGFITGTSTLDVYNGAILAAKSNVVVASMQYRIGVFGFLYLSPALTRYEQDEIPGNMGLWDQFLAIKWLKQNAIQFGANPKLLTLFGESAGAISANLHLLSPKTRGLTNRIILQSGNLNVPWSHMTGKRAVEIAMQFIDRCGCNATTLLKKSSKRVLTCMRSVTAKQLSINQWQFYSGFMGFPSLPTIDGIFMPTDPVTMLKKFNFTNVDILMGSNKDEGTYHMFYDYMKYFRKDTPTPLSRPNFIELINKIFQNASLAEREAIIFQYTNWENFTDNYQNQRKLCEAVSQKYFICPTNEYAEQLSQLGANVYYYYFTQRSSTSLWGDWMGVLHGDEIEYFFGLPMNKSLTYAVGERALSYLMVNIIAKFSKTGTPLLPPGINNGSSELVWPKYTVDNPFYYELNAVRLNRIEKGPIYTACTFWNKYLPKLRTWLEPQNLLCRRKSSASSASAPVSLVNFSLHNQHLVITIAILIKCLMEQIR